MPAQGRPAPMKAKDVGSLVDWGGEQPFAALAPYLTERYALEPKLDGVRVQLDIGATGSRVFTASLSGGAERTANFPHLARIGSPELAGAIIDAELIAPTPRIKGRSGWTNSLLNASTVLATSNPPTSIALQRAHGVAQLWAFDLLAAPSGIPMTGKSYTERRAMLELVVELVRQGCSAVYLVDSMDAEVAAVAAALDAGFEGVVLKARTASYRPGSRRGEWLKLKRQSTADGFIVGYSPGESGWRGQVGSLELALRRPDGTDLLVASVGVPLTAMRQAMSADDGSLRPEWYGRVVEFCAQGIGSHGRARHPRLLRLRPDKGPEDCGVDQLAVFARV